MKPEWEVLALCARTTLNARASDRLRVLLAPGIDYNELLRLSDIHHVTPLIAKSLERTAPDLVPESMLAFLKGRYRNSLQTALLFSAELHRVLAEMKTAGVTAIPYKGPALAAAAYGDVALRLSGDLDFLVRAEDAPRVAQALNDAGYEPRNNVFVGSDDPGDMTRLTRELCLWREIGGKRISVEIHWALLERYIAFPITVEMAIQRAGVSILAGKEIPSMAPDDLLLTLIAHASKHMWSRLLWLCDIAEIFRSETRIDWDAFVVSARQGGCLRMTAIAAILAEDLLEAPVPEPVRIATASDPKAQLLAEKIRTKLFEMTHAEQTVSMNPFHWQMRERRRERVYVHLAEARWKLAYLMTINDHDRKLIRLPRALNHGYYFVKAWRVGRNLVRRRLGGQAD
ncbi:hypothetical protein BH09SUM1_BH09SUM1_13290 [soil metagenome]